MEQFFAAAVAGLIVAAGFVGSVVAGPLEDGAAAVRGDYAAALQLWRPLANQGNAAAQYNLGLMYADGHGVAQDDAAAMSWFRKTADQGYADAQYNLGLMYADGQGVAQDDAAAMG
jgi:TPR repeat protein